VHTNGEKIAVKLFRFMGMDDTLLHKEINTIFINALDRLKHPNIVRLVAFCNETESVFVEYEGKLVKAKQIHQALCLPYFHNGCLAKHISGTFHGSPHPLYVLKHT